MQYMQTKTIVRSCALAMSILAAGCSGGGNGGGSGGGDVNPIIDTNARPLFFDSFGVIPVNNGQTGSYVLHLNNISDKNYTLESISVRDAGAKEEGSKLVNVSGNMCTTLVAGSRCSITISPKVTDQSATVILSVAMRSDDGKVKTVNQMIRMSNRIGDKDGIYFRNDISELNASDGNYGISIPVLLEEDYDDIKASNGDLLCSTHGFKKGNSCTLTIHGRTLKDNTVLATELTAYRGGKKASKVSATSLVRTNNKAELLMSHGVQVLANNDEVATIAVFNDGGAKAAITGKSVMNNSKLKLEDPANNACSGELEAGDSCFINVKADSELNGEEPVTVDYDDGLSLRKKSSVKTDVRYIAPNAEMNELEVTASGSLLNVLIGNTAEQQLTITNKGNRALKNLDFTHNKVDGIVLNPAGTAPCGPILDKGSSCNMLISYTPTMVQGPDYFLVNISGKYQTGAGTEMPLRQYYTTQYSSLDQASINLLSISTSDTPNLIIKVNDSTEAGATKARYIIKNTSSEDNGYAAKLTAKPTLNPGTIAGLTITAPDSGNLNDCNQDNAVIAAGASCAFNVKYAGATAVQAKTDVKLSTQYQIEGVAKPRQITLNAKDFYVEALENGAIIRTNLDLVGANYSGSGELSGDPYKFTALMGKRLYLNYTFKNVGNQDADKFRVNTGSLPSGVDITNSTNCAFNSTKLEVNSSCTLQLSVPADSFFSEVANLTNTDTVLGSFMIPLSYNMDGNNYSSITRYLSFSRNWANAKYEIDPNIMSSQTQHKVTIKVSLPKVDDSYYPVKVDFSKDVAVQLPATIRQSCQIAAGEDSCDVAINFDRTKYVAGSKVEFQLGVLGKGMAEKDAVYTNLSVRIPDTQELTETGVSPDGSVITINGNKIPVSLENIQLPDTPANEKPQITNIFSLGDGSSHVLAQTNSAGNQLVVVDGKGNVTPVTFPVVPQGEGAKPLEMTVFPGLHGGMPVVLAKDPNTSPATAQYATIDKDGKLNYFGDSTDLASHPYQHFEPTPLALPDGSLLVQEYDAFNPTLSVLTQTGEKLGLAEWLTSQGYDYSAWTANGGKIPMSGFAHLGADNNIYLHLRNSKSDGYIYQLKHDHNNTKSLLQLGDNLSTRTSAKISYADPVNNIYYLSTNYSSWPPTTGGYFYYLDVKENKWRSLEMRIININTLIFKKTGASIYPIIYAQSPYNNEKSGFYKSVGGGTVTQIAGTSHIYWSQYQNKVSSDSAGDIYSINRDNQLVRLDTKNDDTVSLISLPAEASAADQSLQPTDYFTDQRITSYNGQIYVKAVALDKKVTVYVYNKGSNQLEKTSYKDLPR